MPSTYTLISSNTLTGSAASVTFSSIPSTYTDLVLRISTRDNSAAYLNPVNLRFNSDSASNYSYTSVYAWYAGANVAASSRTSNRTYLDDVASDGANGTSNTFASTEIYIPSYTVSQNKPLGINSAAENNFGATNYSWQIQSQSGLWRNTAAISTIEISANRGSDSFVTGSSFYLYGIRSV